MIATLWFVGYAGAGCGDGKPCDPDQRYERGLCIAIEQDAAVGDVDAGTDASSVQEAALRTTSGAVGSIHSRGRVDYRSVR
jgi:hypothetical protein